MVYVIEYSKYTEDENQDGCMYKYLANGDKITEYFDDECKFKNRLSELNTNLDGEIMATYSGEIYKIN
jgi:hypothetical protein